MASGGSFSTNSPASPLSSISLTSPLSLFSPVPGSHVSPNKQLGPEVSTGHTQLGTNPNSKPGTSLCTDTRTNLEVHRRSRPKPRPKSFTVPNYKSDTRPRCRHRSYRESETSLLAESINFNHCETFKHTFPQPSLAFKNHWESSARLDPVIEETDRNIKCRANFNLDQPRSSQQSLARIRAGEELRFLQVQYQNFEYTNQHSYTVQTQSDLQETKWLSLDGCIPEVRVGLRKDVYPDSNPPQLSARYHNGLPSKRCFSMPESQLLLLHDSFCTDVLSLHCSQDLHAPSVLCFRSTCPKTQPHCQPASLSLSDAGACARPLTYPNNQKKLGSDPVIFVITPSDNHSGKVLMQSHL